MMPPCSCTVCRPTLTAWLMLSSVLLRIHVVLNVWRCFRSCRYSMQTEMANCSSVKWRGWFVVYVVYSALNTALESLIGVFFEDLKLVAYLA
jgi:hypothetical protein